MSVIPFPRIAPRIAGDDRREERLRGIEQCLDALGEEADELGLDLLAHMIAVARQAAQESFDELRR